MYGPIKLNKVKHDDGRTEMIVSDGTLELIAYGLDRMRLSLPLNEEKDYDTIYDYLEGLDIEIGQVQSEGIYATEKYSTQVCRAFDEFNLDDDEYIDYGDVNRRLNEIVKEMNAETYDPIVKIMFKRGPLPRYD